MEELKICYEEVEEAFDEFVYAASEAACYADEHPEIDYSGNMETVALGLEPIEVDELLKEEIFEAQNASHQVQDKIQKLEKEMQVYRETQDEKPEECFRLGEQFSEFRDQFRELDDEVNDIIMQFGRSDKPENRNPAEGLTGKLPDFLPFEPKR